MTLRKWLALCGAIVVFAFGILLIAGAFDLGRESDRALLASVPAYRIGLTDLREILLVATAIGGALAMWALLMIWAYLQTINARRISQAEKESPSPLRAPFE